MAAPLPIPTLPISSTTAAQAAHIASLTTQLHQLVDKNNVIAAKLEQSQKEARDRLNAEVQRSDDIVRRMRDAHTEEMEKLQGRMETLRVSAVHAQQSMAYAHQVTKHDLLLLEQSLEQNKRQYLLQAAALVRATGAERLLASRYATTKGAHTLQVEALSTKLEQAQAELIAHQTRVSATDDKLVSKLKTQLESVQSSLTTTQAAVRTLESSNTKLSSDLANSEAAHEKLRLELREEKKVRKGLEKDLKEAMDELAAKDSVVSHDIDAAKQQKRRLRELEVALASEQRRVADLEAEKGDWEKDRSVWKVEKRKLEREVEKQGATLKTSTSREESSTMKPKKEVEAKKEALKTKEKDVSREAPKSKKRPREDGESDEERGVVIQGAFGAPVKKSEPEKKRKKAKLDESDTELPKSKPLKAPKSTTTAPSKPRKAVTASKPLVSSPPPPSPSPMSTPQMSEEEEDAPVAVKPKKKVPIPVEPARPAETTVRKKFKAPPRPKDGEPVGGGDDSDDLASKRAKYFGGGGDAKKPAKEATTKKAVPAKVKTKATARDDNDEEEVFDVEGVSSATDEDEEEEVRVEKPKTKSAPAPKVDKPKPKQRTTSKAPEVGDNKAPTKKAGTSKTGKEKVVESENVEPAKPKKRTINLNLVGNLVGGVGGGSSFGALGYLAGSQNLYNIPQDLSSPIKGGGIVPRANFEFGKGGY